VNWFWVNIPLMVIFFAAVAGILGVPSVHSAGPRCARPVRG
jgi:hypothetical protein